MGHQPLLNQLTDQTTVLIIKPKLSAIKRIKGKIKEIIRPQRPMEGIVREINPILRGWSEYFRIPRKYS